MNNDDVIDQAARVLARLEPGEDWPTNESLGGGMTGTRDDEHRQEMLDQARALADAGLLARPLPTREEIASTVYKHSETLTEFPDGPVTCESCTATIDGANLGTDLSSHQADAVLALLKGRDQ